jgi:hypothetical protein
MAMIDIWKALMGGSEKGVKKQKNSPVTAVS